MKAGDIILVDGNGVVSDIIENVTDAEFSHVAIAISEQYVAEAEAPGVVVRNINEYCDTHYMVMRPVMSLSQKQTTVLIDAAYGFTGLPYNWFETVWIGIKRLLHLPGKNPFLSKKAGNCVNLIVDCYAAVGVQLFQTDDPGDIVPGDFANNDLLYKVFEHPAKQLNT